jgi:hypothetical protein
MERHNKTKLITRQQFKSIIHITSDEEHTITEVKVLQRRTIVPSIHSISILTNAMALRLSLVSFRIPKRHPTKETKSQKKKSRTTPSIFPERISSTPKGTSPKMRKRQYCLFVVWFSQGPVCGAARCLQKKLFLS